MYEDKIYRVVPGATYGDEIEAGRKPRSPARKVLFVAGGLRYVPCQGAASSALAVKGYETNRRYCMDFSLITDWLGREGGDIISWWLLVTLAGAAAWPLLYRILGGLPDRGYTLARAAGLMLTGFIFWFLGSLGMLENTPGGMVFAWMVVLVIGLVAFFRWDDRPPVRDWLREHSPLIIVTEMLIRAAVRRVGGRARA